MKCQLVDKFTYFINKNSSTRIKIKVTTQGEVCDLHLEQTTLVLIAGTFLVAEVRIWIKILTC